MNLFPGTDHFAWNVLDILAAIPSIIVYSFSLQLPECSQLHTINKQVNVQLEVYHLDRGHPVVFKVQY
jgi:hypothetical protein